VICFIYFSAQFHASGMEDVVSLDIRCARYPVGMRWLLAHARR